MGQGLLGEPNQRGPPGGGGYLDLEEDSVPDCLEGDDEDYTILAQTAAWEAYNTPDSQKMRPEEATP